MTEQEKQDFIRAFETLTLSNLAVDADVTTLTIAQYVRLQRLQGVDDAIIKANMVADLKEGGQLFGGFRKATRSRLFTGIEQSADQGMITEQQERGFELYEWENIIDGGSCEGCLSRGEEPANTYDYWVRKGLPGTGSTPCLFNCRCDIVATGVYTSDMKDEASAIYYKDKYNSTHDKQLTLDEARKKVSKI